MTQSRVERANSSTPSFDGLTPLHLAVLQDKYATVRSIVHDGELGMNALTATKTTPLMFAALYGRSDIFLYLLRKGASPDKKDSKGNTPLNYAKPRSAFFQNLLHQYESIATKSPDTSRRVDIYRVLLKVIKPQSKEAYDQGHAAVREESRTAKAQLQTSAHMNQADQQQTLRDPPTRLVFLRSPGSKQQEFAEVRQVAVAQHGYFARKCTGFIRGADENSNPVFALSGWGIKGDNAVRENVLDDMEYTGLVKRVAELLEFELVGNYWLDQHFPGNPSEQKGAYVACHSEKKLAIYVLMKALSHVLNTKALTINNIVLLKDQLNKLPSGLRETTIHLDHKVICSSCVQFLDILTQKTGLAFRCESHDWYIPGERPQLVRDRLGNYQQVTNATKPSGSHKVVDVIDDELGLFDNNHNINTGRQCDSMDDEGDSVMIHSDPVTPLMSTSRRACSAPQLMPKWLHEYAKRGSPVEEEPYQHNIRQYATFNVTPPSGWRLGMPTPESHTRSTKIPRITTSPSPAGMSSAFGSENQADSMSPSLSQEFEVEEILQAKEENGVQWYLVKWRGYPYDNNSWEPGSNLTNASDAIRKFWEALQAVGSQTQDMDA